MITKLIIFSSVNSLVKLKKNIIYLVFFTVFVLGMKAKLGIVVDFANIHKKKVYAPVL